MLSRLFEGAGCGCGGGYNIRVRPETADQLNLKTVEGLEDYSRLVLQLKRLVDESIFRLTFTVSVKNWVLLALYKFRI